MILLILLPLTACTTMMTPQQHQAFARDLAVLKSCDEAGLISPELVAQAMHLYRSRLQNYKYDENIMNKYFENYEKQIHQDLKNSNLCRSYSSYVHSEILDRQQALRNTQEFTQALSNFANTYANSMYQQAQMYNNATQSMMYQTPTITPIQPAYSIQPPQIKTTCMNVGNGMYNCTSKPR